MGRLCWIGSSIFRLPTCFEWVSCGVSLRRWLGLWVPGRSASVPGRTRSVSLRPDSRIDLQAAIIAVTSSISTASSSNVRSAPKSTPTRAVACFLVMMASRALASVEALSSHCVAVGLLIYMYLYIILIFWLIYFFSVKLTGSYICVAWTFYTHDRIHEHLSSFQ